MKITSFLLSKKLAKEEVLLRPKSNRLSTVPDVLQSAQFSTVVLEEMKFKEQVELMYSKTNILIGIHGAGLSHTIFLPPEVQFA